jgi:two-component system chemotaxis sensor kinase CheA
MEEYRDLFLAEAQEYLQDMTRCLLDMEKNSNSEQLTEMFRAAHSLKGMAGTMGYELITGLTHEMESLLDQLRSGKAAIETGFVNMLFEAVDLVQLLVDNLDKQEDFNREVAIMQEKLQGWQENPGKEVAFKSDTLEQGEQLQEGKPPVRESWISWKEIMNEFEKEMLKDALSRGDNIYHVHVCLLHGCLLKSVRAYMVLKAVEKQGEVIKTMPPLQALEEENFDWEFSLLLVGRPDMEALKKSIESIAEIESADILPVNIEDKPETPVTAPLNGDSAAAPLFPGKVSLLMENEEETPEETPRALPKVKAPSLSARNVEKTVRVETAKLDSLVNLVGELIINRTRVVDLGKKVSDEMLESSLEQLERITTELQNAVMTLRMVPIKQVFDRFPRMVRDLCLERNKEVELLISGEDTELDRTIVNQVGDPLVHLLRNAVDHGIEEAEERIKNGKNPAGKIFLEAHHEGSHVVVSVEDDGRGMDPQVIKTRALEKKIITGEEAEKMSSEEALRLIFRSGFSTSEEVTDISGRGVGMDVVRTAIETLNGTVEVKSNSGKGSRFILRFPLTLAIIRTLMVQSGKEVYAIPIEAIRENLFVDPQEIKTIRQGKVITLREEVLPLYSLQESLGMGQFREQEVYPVVVVQTGDKKAGLIVDELLGQQEVVIKSLGNFINDIKGIAGATVLGDGRVTLILDVASLLDDGRVNLGKKSINH